MMPSEELQQKDIEMLNKAILRLEKSTSEGFEKVNTRLDIMNDHFIRKDLFDEKVLNLTQDISELKDSNKWLFRTVSGLIFSIIAGIIFTVK